MQFGMFVNWEFAGSLLATQNSEVQAKFLTAFCKEMKTWPTAYSQEMQLVCVCHLLSEEDRALLANLGPIEPE